MTKTPTFKKADAAQFAKQLAQDVAEQFNVAAPEIEEDTLREWEFRLATIRVWTKAGPARISIDVSATFAHLYFQFYDVKRASALSLPGGSDRLNRHSGKWNNWHAPDGEVELRHFRVELLDDFRRVAEPQPDPAEVAEFEAKQAAEEAKWAAAREEFQATNAPR